MMITQFAQKLLWLYLLNFYALQNDVAKSDARVSENSAGKNAVFVYRF